jgi:hypothetical protein
VSDNERDRKIEALAAERVIGTPRERLYYTLADGIERVSLKYLDNPLSSDGAAFALLDAHPEWVWTLERYVLDYDCYIERRDFDDTRESWNASDDDRRRAITYAAIRAVGAGAELDALLVDET